MAGRKLHLFQFATNPVCARYRLLIPAVHLRATARFRVTTFRRLTRPLLQRILDEADLLILQRLPCSPGVARLIDLMAERRKPVIFEIDDDLFSLSPASFHLRNAPPDYLDRLRETLLRCHAVQCSTVTLAERLRRWHPEVQVLQNQLSNLLEPGEPPVAGNRLVIGYAAGCNHLTDWQTIGDACNATLQELERSGLEIEVRVFGDRGIFDSLQCRNKRLLPLMPYEAYLRALAELDISLMPLADTPFNHAKSDVKFLESAAACCAVLASTVVYGESIRDGKTGLLYASPEQFGGRLRDLAAAPERIRSLARNAHDYVRRHRMMSSHIHEWEATYLDWYDRRETLVAGQR